MELQFSGSGAGATMVVGLILSGRPQRWIEVGRSGRRGEGKTSFLEVQSGRFGGSCCRTQSQAKA